MKFKRFICAFLVALTVLSAFALPIAAATEPITSKTVKGMAFSDNFSTLLENSVRYTIIDLSFEQAGKMINDAEAQRAFDENIHFLTDCGISIILRLDFEDELSEDFLAEAKTAVEYLYKRYTDYSKKNYVGYIGSYIIGKSVDSNAWDRANTLSLADTCVNIISQSRGVAKHAKFYLGVSNNYAKVSELIDNIEEFTVSSPIPLAVSLGNLTESSIEFSETEKKITPANINNKLSLDGFNNVTVNEMILCDAKPNGENDTANAKIYAYTYYKAIAMGNVSAFILSDDTTFGVNFSDMFEGVDTDKNQILFEELFGDEWQEEWKKEISVSTFKTAAQRTIIDTEKLLKKSDDYKLSTYKKRLMSSLDSAQKIIKIKNGEYNSVALKFDTPVPPNLLVFDIDNADEDIVVELCATTTHASYNLTMESDYAKQETSDTGSTFTYVFDLTPLKEASGDLISVVINMYTLNGKKRVPVDSVELSHISLYSTRGDFTVQMIFIIIILILAITVPYFYYVFSKRISCPVDDVENEPISPKKPVQRPASEQPQRKAVTQRPAPAQRPTPVQRPNVQVKQSAEETRNKQRRDDFELL